MRGTRAQIQHSVARRSAKKRVLLHSLIELSFSLVDFGGKFVYELIDNSVILHVNMLHVELLTQFSCAPSSELLLHLYAIHQIPLQEARDGE